jgi:hypothetical protein
MQTIRTSEPLRAFAPPARIESLLEEVGNELNNYSAFNFAKGASNLYVSKQVASGSSDQDPSWYTLPAFQDLVWFQQLESNPAIATKVIYFTWTLSRNWGPDSLRLFHFLPYARAHGIASNHFKCTRDDWALAIRGLALTYGALYDDAFQDIFQRMHSEICNGQIGHSFSFPFLEAYTSDMFYRLSVATHTPTTPTYLPGNPVAVITADYTPRIWAQAFMTGFNSITTQFNSPLSFLPGPLPLSFTQTC